MKGLMERYIAIDDVCAWPNLTVLADGTLAVAISQSGETADTLAALREARDRGAKTLAICNVIDAAIPRACADSLGTIYTRAGPEIGVASTKAFVTQLVALHLLAIALGQRRGLLDEAAVNDEMTALSRVPRELEEMLGAEAEIREFAHSYVHTSDMLFLGRGMLYPIALEGALKLKEISYIHAEGYPAGEMKHGPIALIDRHTPTIAIALRDQLYSKMSNNIQQIQAREGKVVAIGSEGDTELEELAEFFVPVPDVNPLIAPFATAIPAQLIAYYFATKRGADVDQPRNLAKTVTVE